MSYLSKAGYRVLKDRAYEHIVAAESALGRKLPPGAPVLILLKPLLSERIKNVNGGF